MNYSDCANCPFSKDDRLCTGIADKTRHPESCMTANGQDILDKAWEEYEKPEMRTFMENAFKQTASGFESVPGHPEIKRAAKTRVQEIADFCKLNGYKRIGLAFCGAVHAEARLMEKFLRSYGFDVVSVMCKVGGISKESMIREESALIHPGKRECMCNPIAQAMILNDAKTEFNLVMGLCVGHDSVFLKYSEAMCTIVAVKDRVLAHNPMAALTCSSYRFLYDLND